MGPSGSASQPGTERHRPGIDIGVQDERAKIPRVTEGTCFSGRQPIKKMHPVTFFLQVQSTTQADDSGPDKSYFLSPIIHGFKS